MHSQQELIIRFLKGKTSGEASNLTICDDILYAINMAGLKVPIAKRLDNTKYDWTYGTNGWTKAVSVNIVVADVDEVMSNHVKKKITYLKNFIDSSGQNKIRYCCAPWCNYSAIFRVSVEKVTNIAANFTTNSELSVKKIASTIDNMEKAADMKLISRDSLKKFKLLTRREITKAINKKAQNAESIKRKASRIEKENKRLLEENADLKEKMNIVGSSKKRSMIVKKLSNRIQ